MNADDVRACLTLRWPDSEYLSIDEAPLQADRGGRKLDRLVVGLWKSRGMQLDGVEIKVSRGDLKKELESPAKADGWYRHVHRFWLAVPERLAEAVVAENLVAGVSLALPPTWGLLACEEGKAPRVAVKAEQHQAAPFDWDAQIGLMRASADAGVAAIWRAERRGRDEGFEQGREQAQREGADGWAKPELDRLRATVKAFEEASGLCLTQYHGGPELGRIVALIRKEFHHPGWTLEQTSHAVEAMRREADGMKQGAKRLEELGERMKSLCAEALIADGAEPTHPRRGETPDA